MMRNIIYALLCLVLAASCTDTGRVFPEGDVIGYKPVYASEVDLTIGMEAARTPETTGKIFLQGDVLLLNEVNEGIHFIDNSDPTNPRNFAFLSIKGSSDMSVKDQLIYVNQYTDIVAIDFSDLDNIRVVEREENAFSLSTGSQLVPSQNGRYFECADPAKGPIVDWQLTTITNPKCYQ